MRALNKNDMKRSKILWVLIVFFSWAALKSAGTIYNAQSVSDYAILSSIGAGFLFYAINAPLMLGEAAAAYLLFKRQASAFFITGAVISAEVINGIFVSAISMLHLDDAKAFYITSREARGLTAKQENIDFIISYQGIAIAVLVYAAFYAILYFLLRKARPELTAKAA
jgi:hypothetical protein